MYKDENLFMIHVLLDLDYLTSYYSLIITSDLILLLLNFHASDGPTQLAAFYFLIKLKNFKIGLILLLNKVIVKISDFYDMLMPNFVSSFCKRKVQL